MHLNEVLTSFRSITLLLQKKRDSIPGFAEWYAPWRERMEEDPQMRWLLDARNEVLHVDDLDLKSTAKVSVVATWCDELFEEYEVPSHLPLKQIGSQYDVAKLPDEVRKDGLLKVERRWVADSFPEWELSALTAYGYGVLAELLSEAHELLGTRMRTLRGEGHGSNPRRVIHSGGPLPCMRLSRDSRSAYLSLETGDVISIPGLVRWQERETALATRTVQEFSMEDPIDLGEKVSTTVASVISSRGLFPNCIYFLSADHEILDRCEPGLVADSQLPMNALVFQVGEMADELDAQAVLLILEFDLDDTPRGHSSLFARSSVVVMTADGRCRGFNRILERPMEGSPVASLGSLKISDDEPEIRGFLKPLADMWARKASDEMTKRRLLDQRNDRPDIESMGSRSTPLIIPPPRS